MPEDQVVDVKTNTGASPTSRPVITNTAPSASDPAVKPATKIPVTDQSFETLPGATPTVVAPQSLLPKTDEVAPAPTPSPLPPAPEQPAAAAVASPPVPQFGELQPKVDSHPLFSGATTAPPKSHSSLLKKTLWPLVALVIAAIIFYLLIDAGVIRGASHLPFHIFKQPVAATTAPTIAPQPVAPTTTATTDPYAGWKTYCSDYGGLCLKYPSLWQLTTQNEPSQTQASVTVASVSILSPSKTVNISYAPSAAYPASQPTATITNEVLGVDPVLNTSDFYVVKNIESSTQNKTTTIAADYYVTSKDNVQKNGITIGNKSGYIDIAGYFVNSKTNHNSPTQDNYQVINVGLAANKDKGNYATFSSSADAKAWLSSDEVKTAGQILASVSYR